jgi:hypothetical protein
MKIHSVLRAMAGAALILASANLAACASGARGEQMVVTAGAAQPGEPGYKAFRVAKVQGGEETNPLLASNVADRDFNTALESSLKASNYLADDPATAKNEITASLIDLKQPMVGLDLSVTSKVRYTATKVDGGDIVFDETIAETGTAKLGEALIAVERLRLANEAAIRANIQTFLEHLHAALAGK